MKLLLKRIYLLYCAFFSIFVPISAFLANPNYPSPLLGIVFLPVTYYFVYKTALIHLEGEVKNIPRRHLPGVTFGEGILTYYSFILITILTVIGFLNIKSLTDLPGALLFIPPFAYLIYSIIPRRTSTPIVTPEKAKGKKKAASPFLSPAPTPAVARVTQRQDPDRRMFLKLIGSAGLSMFFLSLFTKKAGAAFFGSVPGPGTVSLKDSGGTQIDPAQRHPTDGYKIAQLDDASPSYYGFTNKDGAWFIMKEDSSGNYRYSKGTSGFSTNWTNRAGLTYDYFDVVF